MQNNSLTNLNNNKILQDKLNTQVATEKKISRPSEDPVIAIRALRLRTNLSEVTQYLEKNVEDADGWLSATEDALSTMNDVIQNMYYQCEKGIDDSLNSESRAAILEQLKGLRDEVYATGDADYAGRTLFTGYRTNETLRFQENTENDNYRITENFDTGSLANITYVDTKTLNEINDGNYATDTTTEQDVAASTIARIQLAYGSLDAVEADNSNAPAISLKNTLNATAVDIKVGETSTITTGTSPATTMDVTMESISTGAAQDPYQRMAAYNETATADSDGLVIYVPETGELLISDNLKTVMQSDSTTTISAEYEKSSWESGDLRPEHYFKCTETTSDGKVLEYSGEAQYMEYDVGYNQKIRVNTLASEAFTHDIGRTVDVMTQASQDVVDMEATIATLTKMVDNDEYPDQDAVTEKLEAANKALTLLKDKEKKLYASGMTAMQGYMAQTNLTTTNLGNRDSRLELIKTRLTSQQTNFKGLVNENEGADVTAVATELKSAETAYDAALLATSKIVQNSLMNYI